jgi:NAD(P)-dependent dehydrogenase (short-subunit alcohol dehydrogenase family)
MSNISFLYSQLFVTPPRPVASCEGKTVIVTGSNGGLGREAARHFARMDTSRLILAVRNTEAGEEAKRDIVRSTGIDEGVIEVWMLDMASYDSIKAFAKRASSLPRIDIVLENAGIATGKFGLAEGHERTITINVIGTFLLALLLLPKLKESAKKFDSLPHLTIVASEMHAYTPFDERKEASIFAALDEDREGAMALRYRASKLLEILVIRQIAPKLKGSNVILNKVNPGFCHSGLARESDTGIKRKLFKTFVARSTEVGSRNLVLAATAGPESNGKYVSDGVVNNEAVSKFVKSEEGEETAKRVWSELSKILEDIQPGVTDQVK